MNNLLLKVLEFFFIPESVLSVLFLLAFAGCFVYGYLKLKDCRLALEQFRLEAPDKFALERGRMNQKQFMLHFTTGLSAKEIRVADLGNVFLMIGILGTFLGLGVAIHGASDLLNSEKVDLMQLNAVLNVIAFKFQTSVWGTCFSLIYQKFFAEPYYIKRQQVLGEVESKIYADAVSAEAAMNSQLDELRAMREEQGSAKDALIHMGAAQNEEGAKRMQEFSGLAEKLVREQEQFNEAVLGGVTDANRTSAMSLAQNVEEQRRCLQELVDKQGTLNADLVRQQEALFGDFSKGNAATLAENLDEQRRCLEELVAKQEETNQTLASQQQALFGDFSATNENHATTMAQNLAEQRKCIEELIEKQTESNRVLAEQQKAIFGDISAANKGNTATLSESLRNQQTYIEQLVEKQNELNKGFAEQQKALFGDLTKAGKGNAVAITQSLAEQRAVLGELIEKQNTLNQEIAAQQKVLFGDMAEANEKSAQTLTQSIAEQKRYMQDLVDKQNELNNNFAEQQKALFGDVMQSNADSAKSFTTSLTQQLEQQRSYMEEMLEKQGDLNEQFANQQMAMWNEAEESSRNSAQALITNMSAQLDQQRDFMQQLMDKQSELNDELAKQQRALWGDAAEAHEKKSKSLVTEIANQLSGQREHMEQLVAQQNRLNEVLLGDLQKTGEQNANAVRTGFVQQMEQYKQFSEALAAEQRQTQKSLEKKLEELSINLSSTSETNNDNIAELRRAIDILQEAIDNNSKVLDDIVKNFYEKQKDLDALRRKEIMGIADTFSTLLHQESSTTAPWRQGNEPEYLKGGDKKEGGDKKGKRK